MILILGSMILIVIVIIVKTACKKGSFDAEAAPEIT